MPMLKPYAAVSSKWLQCGQLSRLKKKHACRPSSVKKLPLNRKGKRKRSERERRRRWRWIQFRVRHALRLMMYGPSTTTFLTKDALQ